MGSRHPSAAPLGQAGSEVPGFHRALSCGAGGHGVPACTLMALGAHGMCRHQLKQGRCDLLLSKLWHHKPSQENCWHDPGKHPSSAAALEWDHTGSWFGEGSCGGFYLG